jgi:hypothetical protein
MIIVYNHSNRFVKKMIMLQMGREAKGASEKRFYKVPHTET